jgi:hypothetical protein
MLARNASHTDISDFRQLLRQMLEDDFRAAIKRLTASGRGAGRSHHQRAGRDPPQVPWPGPRDSDDVPLRERPGDADERGAHARRTSLTRGDRVDAVNHIRHLFQEAMEADFRMAVERITGQKVLAFISGNYIDPDVAAQLFILDGPVGRPRRSHLIVSRRRSAAV